MKHLLNNLTQEEKNNILEQHAGGMKVMTENFRKLMNAKHGNSKPLVNEQVRSADNEYYSDNSLSKPGRVYLKNGDKDEVDEILSNLPTDTLFLALVDCEEADFSNIDLGEFKSLLFINLKGTPNNLLRTQGDYFEHDKKGFYITTKNI
jgi:hypothetical protein